jgi:hypothetical protein
LTAICISGFEYSYKVQNNYMERRMKRKRSPGATKLWIQASDRIEGVPADLGIAEVAEGLAEDVWFADEVAVAVGIWPSTVARTGSAIKFADTPEEFVHAELWDPTPATKFTCMHCRAK